MPQIQETVEEDKDLQESVEVGEKIENNASIIS